MVRQERKEGKGNDGGRGVKIEEKRDERGAERKRGNKEWGKGKKRENGVRMEKRDFLPLP